MTHTDPLLRPGDLVLIDLAPVKGTEQDGRRPALVVSETDMHMMTRSCHHLSDHPQRGSLADQSLPASGLGAEGAVLVDQVRAIDRRERILRVLGAVPPEVLHAVRDKLAALLGLPPR